jgi:hypothetical protein
MALIKCSECGQEISEKAEKCPKCGNPINQPQQPQEKVKKKGGCFKVVAISLGAIFGLMLIIMILGVILNPGPGSPKKQTSPPKTAAPAPVQPPVTSTKPSAPVVVTPDQPAVEPPSTSDNSTIQEIEVSSNELVLRYTTDADEADKTYKDKRRQVRGIVEEIVNSTKGKPVVNLIGGSDNVEVLICEFPEGTLGINKLHKAQAVTFSCKIDGLSSKFLILNECSLVDPIPPLKTKDTKTKRTKTLKAKALVAITESILKDAMQYLQVEDYDAIELLMNNKQLFIMPEETEVFVIDTNFSGTCQIRFEGATYKLWTYIQYIKEFD